MVTGGTIRQLRMQQSVCVGGELSPLVRFIGEMSVAMRFRNLWLSDHAASVHGVS
jgi:hypothetical protein